MSSVNDELQKDANGDNLESNVDKDKECIGGSNESLNRKNRNAPNAKGGNSSGKGRMGKHNSSGNSSLELPTSNNYGQSSTQYDFGDFNDHWTDQNGVDLLQFFKITLNKNPKDRHMLLRIENELATLARDEKYVKMGYLQTDLLI